jgi:hypothetical protein
MPHMHRAGRDTRRGRRGLLPATGAALLIEGRRRAPLTPQGLLRRACARHRRAGTHRPSPPSDPARSRPGSLPYAENADNNAEERRARRQRQRRRGRGRGPPGATHHTPHRSDPHTLTRLADLADLPLASPSPQRCPISRWPTAERSGSGSRSLPKPPISRWPYRSPDLPQPPTEHGPPPYPPWWGLVPQHVKPARRMSR